MKIVKSIRSGEIIKACNLYAKKVTDCKATLPYYKTPIVSDTDNLKDGDTLNVFFTIGVDNRRIGFPYKYKTPFKLMKEIWYDEYADADLFTPSCPHLHSLNGKYKLNVYTGEVYDTQTKKISDHKRVPLDELDKLWADPKFYDFAKKMRKIYFSKYPSSNLPPMHR